MFSHFEAELIAIDAEIAQLKVKLVDLRRRRNMLVPIGTLSVELISEVIGHLISDVIREGNRLRDRTYVGGFCFFSWISVTQFCAQWRYAALADSSLWTYLWTMNLRWFQLFLDRSKFRPLYVGTFLPMDNSHWPLVNDSDYMHMFRLLIANMRRVHTLNFRPQYIDERLRLLRNVPDPRLEVLRYIENPESDIVGLRSFPDPVNPNTMPKLRRIDISTPFYDSEEWDHLLPSHLPTVTHLTIARSLPEHILELLDRCKAIQVLSICVDSEVGTESEFGQTIVLPNLHHLEFQNIPWAIFDSLVLPSVRYIKLGTASINESAAEAFSVVTDLLQSMLAVNYSSPRFLLTVLLYEFRIAVQVARGETVLDFSISRTVPSSEGNHLEDIIVLNNLLQLVQTTNGVVQSLDIWNAGCDIRTAPDLPYFFRSNGEISEIHIRDLSALKALLSFSNAGQHVCPSFIWGRRPFCDCNSCRTLRVISYPGLQTVKLGLQYYRSFDFGDKDNKVWLDYLVDWLQEREGEDYGLRKLYVRNCENTSERSKGYC